MVFVFTAERSLCSGFARDVKRHGFSVFSRKNRFPFDIRFLNFHDELRIDKALENFYQYRHNDTGEDNADAHIKRQIMGREVMIAITKGKLDFGPWEQIFYGEFDGRRKKRVLVKIIGE